MSSFDEFYGTPQYCSGVDNLYGQFWLVLSSNIQFWLIGTNMNFIITLQGRNGLGNIYVWASGDGGEDDDCNCDGYAASMWTISINSAINTGENAHYDESCSSTLASTFSNGAKDPNTGVVS